MIPYFTTKKIKSYCKLTSVVFAWLISCSFQQIFAEGTKEIRPTVNDYGFLILDSDWSNFAFYDCPAENRLQISVCNPNEIIYFGFNQTDGDIQFQLKDNAGNVVFGPMIIPGSGQGFIANFNQAVAGPQQIVGASGYNALSYVAATPGDYYIEFRKPPSRREFDLFDITVASPANVPLPGRVWSKAWMFSTRSFTTQFKGELYIYADDGIVTSLDFNGMQPYVFVLSANKSGTGNTGNTVVDRQSKSGNVTYPQYKIFLNNPDTTCFPTGKFGNLTKPTTITGCGQNRCINIFVDKPGNIEITLDLDGNPGYQPNTADRIISASVDIGANCIAWDSKDGKGNLVSPGKNIPMDVNYFNGLTHLPLYDVEGQPNGYIVNLVRPSGPKPQLFWDDSQIKPPNPQKVNLTGCSNPSGCHTWVWAGSDNPATDYGNTNTINTWWYANVIHTSASFTMGQVVVDANTNKPANLGNDTTVCATVASIQMAGLVNGSNGGVWSGGAGNFSPDRNTLNAIYTPTSAEKTSGKVKIILTSNAVADCPPLSDSMNIVFTPPPVANAGADQSVCSNVNTIMLNGSVTVATGGVWTGGLGKFAADSTSLNAIYSPAGSENSGTLTLTLTTTGNGLCSPVSDQMKITFTKGPTVNAGKDTSVCSVNPVIQLSGAVTTATGGIWTGGTGQFTPDATTLNAKYTPTATEISAGSVTLTLTSAGNGSCNSTADQVKITFTGNTIVDAGSDKIVCANAKVTLNGAVTGASGGTWSGGKGTFSPDANTLNATYTPDKTETDAGKVQLVLTSSSDGCMVAKDTLNIVFTPSPSVDAGPDMSSCANNPTVQLNATETGATGVLWTSDGGGTFIPNATTINATYTPSSDEINAKVASLQVSTTGNGGCNAVKDIVLIAINPAPTADAGPDQMVCKNNPAVTLNGKATNTPSSKAWSGGGGTFSPSANQDNPGYVPSADEVSSGSIILTYTVNKTGCNPVSDNMQVTFTTAPTANAGSAQSVCFNNPSVTLNGSYTTADSAKWSGGKGTFSPTAGTLTATYTPDPSELAKGNFQLYLTTSGNLNCQPVKDSVTVTVTPAPQIDAGQDQTVCSNNAQVMLQGSIQKIATGGTWSGGNGTFSPNANDLNAKYLPTATEIAAGSMVLTLTSTGNGNCQSVTDQVKISFSPVPTANAGNDITVCADNPAATLKGSFSQSLSGVWSGGNGAFSPDATTLNTIYNPSLDEINHGTVTLVLTSVAPGTYGSCSPVSDNVQINITPAPTANAGPDQTACGNVTTLPLNGNITVATGGTWSTNGSGTFVPDANTLTASYKPSDADKNNGMVLLTLTTTGNGLCNPVSDQMRIDFTTVPKINAGPNQTVCTNDFPFTLKGSGTPGSWTDGAGTFSPSRNSLNAIYTPSAGEVANGSVVLHVSTNGTLTCPSVSDSVKITFIPGPKTDAGKDASICGNTSTYQLQGGINSGFQGIWATSGTGSFMPSVNDLAARYQISAADKQIGFVDFTLISVNNGMCNIDSSKVRLTILPEPTVNAGPAEKICADAQFIQLKGELTGATSAQWSTSGSGSFQPANSDLNATYIPSAGDISNGQVLLTLTSLSDGVCLPVQSSKGVTIAPGPKANAGPDVTICGDSSYTQLSGNVTVASGGKWTTSGSGSFSPNEYDLNAKYYPSAQDVSSSKVFLILTTQGNGNCNPVSDTLIINITPIPVVNPGLNSTVCSDISPILLNGSVATATGIHWTSNGSGSFANPDVLNASYTPSAADRSNGILTFTATSTGNGTCKAVSSSVIKTITHPPIANGGGDQTICADASGVSLSGTVSITGKGKWTTSGTGTFLPNDTILNATYKPSLTDTASHKVQLMLTTSTIGNCIPRLDTVHLVIKPAPVVNAGPDQTVCSDTSGVLLNGMIVHATGNTWSSSGSGKFYPNAFAPAVRYVPSLQDMKSGNVTFKLTSSGNGTCMAVTDIALLKITPAPTVQVGNDTLVCTDAIQIPLKAISTVASGGYWSASGNGKFSPDSSRSNASYLPSDGDKSIGSTTLTYTTTGNGTCKAVHARMHLTINPAPVVNAGPDISICASETNIDLQGTVKNAQGVIWSSRGTGFFTPDNTSLKTRYLITSADKNAQKVSILLTSSGNGFCNPVTDTLNLFIAPEPKANAGADMMVCATTNSIALNGNIQNASGGFWVSSGTGYFSPNETALNASYVLSDADKQSSSFRLTLTSTGNGLCNQSSDQLIVQVSPSPKADAGQDIQICADREFVLLNGAMTNAVKGSWSSSGNGFFSPGSDTAVTGYIPSKSDKLNGTVELTFTSFGNGICAPSVDQLLLTIIPAPTLDAGPDQTLCPDVPFIQVNPMITIATNAAWSSTGSGIFDPGPDNINVKYIPSPDDIAAGSIRFDVATTGNGICNALYDSVRISFTGVPKVNAGNDKTYCTNSFPIHLDGSGNPGTWSGFTGTIQPDAGILNSLYTPSANEISAGFVQLFLTSSGGGTCPPSKDTVVFTLKDGPVAKAGPAQSVCSTTNNIQLGGVVSIATGGLWSTSGTGTFSANDDLNATYIPSPTDKIGGNVVLTLTTTGNGSCEATADKVDISIVPAPAINAGLDRIVCADASGIAIQGSRINAGSSIWSSIPAGGSFGDNTALSTLFMPSAGDISSGSVQLVLQTIGAVSCPNVSDTVLVHITPPVTVDAGTDQVLCADVAEVDLSASKTVAGGITWSTSGKGYFMPDIHSMNARYIPAAADTAGKTVSIFINTIDNGTCKPAGDMMSIKFTPAPQVNAGNDQTICSDIPSVQLQANFTVASGISWSTSGKGTFSSSNTQPNVTYILSKEDKTAGGAVLTLTSTGNGTCKPVVDYLAVHVLPVPAAIVNAGYDQTLCANIKSVQLNGIVKGAGGGMWKSSGNGQFLPNTSTLDAQYIPTSQDTAAGKIQISLTTTDNGVCNPVTDTLTVTFVPAPSSVAGPSQTICGDSSFVQLKGSISNAQSGLWTSSGTGIFSPAPDNLAPRYVPSQSDVTAGKVGLTLTTTGNGICDAAISAITLTITPPPTVSAGPDDSVCASIGVINLKGSKKVAKGVVWSTSGTGSFGPDEFSLAPTYTISKDDINDGTILIQIRSTLNGTCKSVTDQLMLTILPAPIVKAGPDETVCANTPGVVLKGTVGIATGGIWSSTGSGTFSPSINSLNATYMPSQDDINLGSISLVLQSAGENNCAPVSDTLVVKITPKPTVNPGSPVVCDLTAGAQLNGIVKFAGGGQWTASGNGTFSPDAYTMNAKYVPSTQDVANQSVTLTLTTVANGVCEAVSSQTLVSVLAAPVADAGKDKIICRGSNTNLVGKTSSNVTYHWETAKGTQISDNEYVNIIAFNDTSFRYVATDMRGCSSKDLVNIGVIDPPTFDMSPKFCLNDTLLVDSKPQNLPLVNGQFQWSKNNSNLKDENRSIIYPGESGKYKIVYSYSSCAALDTTTIYDSPQLVFSDRFACEGDLTQLKTSALQNVIYSWTLKNVNVGNQNAINVKVPVDTNFYKVQGTDTISGCMTEVSSRVIGLPKPVINLTNLSACEKDTLLLNARPANIASLANLTTTYAWKKDNQKIAYTGDSLFITKSGNYSVVVTVEVCSSSDTSGVVFNPLPLGLPEHETEFCSESDPYVVLQGGTEKNITYLWLPSGHTTINDTVKAGGMYQVVMKNQYQCSSKDSILVKDVCPPHLYVPNAFIPNSPTEPLFKVFGKDFTNYKITVFSRWGEIIWYSESKEDTWDGNYRGAPMPIGVYTYIITYEGAAKASKGPYKMEGSITIVR